MELMNNFISFRDFFLTEGFVTRDPHFWEAIYETWWGHVERAVSDASKMPGNMKLIKEMRPSFSVTGPEMQIDFYEIADGHTGSPMVAFENKTLSEDSDEYYRGTYILSDYDIDTVKEWWEENWEYFTKGPKHLNPPDEADMWKHQGDSPNGAELVEQLNRAIANEEPATDVKEIYWDAIHAGIERDALDIHLYQAVTDGLLAMEEVEYIKKKPGPPGNKD